MSEERRAILDQVASGQLDPTEAARLLDQLEERTAHMAPPGEHEQTEELGWAALPPTETALRGIRVSASAGSVRVIGDPDVAEVSVQGPHSLRRSGDIVIVECGPLHARPLDAPMSGGWILTHDRPPAVHLPRFRSTWRQISVRVNPDLALDLEVAAGQLSVRGSRGALRCTVSAGSASLQDVRGPLVATVAAGALSVRGPIRTGESRIECDMGSANIHLEDGADVRVRVRTSLGRAVVDLDDVPASSTGGRQEWVVGQGRALLDIEANLGSITVDRSDDVDVDRDPDTVADRR